MMNGMVLLIPMVLIRYGLLYAVDPKALKRAAFFPPMIGVEKMAYGLYQLATFLMLISLCFLRVTADAAWFYPGLCAYVLGILLLAIATIQFARPAPQGVPRTQGLYRFSRNPMYVAYFLYFLGCVLLTKSLLLLFLLVVFQAASHWIILSEERWCLQAFAELYAQYMKKVRRYL